MAVDSRQQLGNMPYDHLRYPAPQFTNPWVSGPSATSHLYATSMPQNTSSVDRAQPPSVSMAYTSQPLPAMSMPSGSLPVDSFYSGQPGLQGQEYAPRPYGTAYPTSSAAGGNTFAAPTSAPQYSTEYHTQPKLEYHSQQPKMNALPMQDRRPSHPPVPVYFGDQLVEAAQKQSQSSLIDFGRMQNASEAERASFNDALDASRGMVAMSQDITPRNIYGGQENVRNASDAYGFPSGHSTHSSISSASTYPSYYNSSASEASYGDYSSASESVDMPSRTLPRPNGLIAGQLPPAPQSMMGQFSSKVSSSSQKKHKCKICDKRFTRPSSLQTHMYSHTGEKRTLLPSLIDPDHAY